MPEGPPSAAEPVSAWPFLIALGSASRVAEVGAVLSIRICVPAVLIASEFETLSTEKY